MTSGLEGIKVLNNGVLPRHGSEVKGQKNVLNLDGLLIRQLQGINALNLHADGITGKWLEKISPAGCACTRCQLSLCR